MKKKLLVLVLLFGTLIALAAYKLNNQDKEKGITATGTIEVTQADIRPKASGYLRKLRIEEGDQVHEGQGIALISRPDLEAQVLRDEAALAKAQIDLQDLDKGSRSQEIEEARANVATAQANLEKTKKDYQRYQNLYQQGAISTRELDLARNAYQTSASTLLAVQSRLNLVEAGNRPERIASQKMEVKRNQAILVYSRSQLGDTVVVSPLGGLVLTKNFEPGEYVNVGESIATIANLKDCWVKIYLASDQLGQIRLGQKAKIRVDSFPGKFFSGVIKEISQKAEFTPRQSITKKERANLVFAVKVKVDNSEGSLKPGMPADVVLQ